jgi:hypothetical protein
MRTDKLDEMLKGRGNWQGKESILCGLTSIIPIIDQTAMTCFPEAATGKFSPLHYDYTVGSFSKLNTKA